MEIQKLRPKYIISFSETVLKQISKECLGKTLTMQESFGEVFDLEIQGMTINYIPVVHLPRVNSKVEKHYFPAQTEKLERMKGKLKL